MEGLKDASGTEIMEIKEKLWANVNRRILGEMFEITKDLNEKERDELLRDLILQKSDGKKIKFFFNLAYFFECFSC